MKNFAINGALLLFTLFLIEVGSFAAGLVLKKKGVFYNSPTLNNPEKYLEDRDPILGWPSKSLLKIRYDTEGSRRIPAFPNPETPACVSIYGDSFTWGDNVEDEETISNYLSRDLNCRVSNFGVAGYGTDQSFLRFQGMVNDEAPVVILNHFSGGIRRNVTRMRNLMADSDSQYILLKPRFKLNNGKLELLPLSDLKPENFKCYAESPERCLDDEYFLPGGDSGIQYLSFPYTVSILKTFKNEHLQAKFLREPVWKRFYYPTHSSGALGITSEIITKFIELARERNKTPIVVVSANIHDIVYFRKSGIWTFQPLLDELSKRGIEVVNFGENLNAYIGTRDPCELGNESCFGHLTAEGNRLNAKTLFNEINKLDLVKLH